MKTTVHNTRSRVGKRTKDIFQHDTPSLVEIELDEKDLPFFENSYEGAHIATVTIRKNGKAARFFMRICLADDMPTAQIIGLRRESNTQKEVVGQWNRQLECAIARDEQAEVNA